MWIFKLLNCHLSILHRIIFPSYYVTIHDIERISVLKIVQLFCKIHVYSHSSCQSSECLKVSKFNIVLYKLSKAIRGFHNIRQHMHHKTFIKIIYNVRCICNIYMLNYKKVCIWISLFHRVIFTCSSDNKINVLNVAFLWLTMKNKCSEWINRGKKEY